MTAFPRLCAPVPLSGFVRVTPLVLTLCKDFFSGSPARDPLAHPPTESIAYRACGPTVRADAPPNDFAALARG